MSERVQGIIDIGTHGLLIDVECHISNDIPCAIVIVGFANKAVVEAKERVRGAFTNAQILLPRKRITINLAPADLPKDSAGFDLSMAVAIMATSQPISQKLSGGDEVFIGKLGLDGTVRPVRGIIGKLLAGRELGIKTFYIPRANLERAMLVPHINLIPVTDLQELYQHLNAQIIIKSINTEEGSLPQEAQVNEMTNSFSDIIGQTQAKRGLEIVAAGGHNILLNGPPGTGKSMLAKTLPEIMPPLSHEEVLEVTHLHSLARKDYDRIITARPFRSPHHSASDTAIIGGDQNPQLGEISLSHRGVLFLDEFPEFSRSAIEALRQPLEDKTIAVARTKISVDYPANFVLVATANPCPRGYYGTNKPCRCLPHQILRYQRKLSGPITDRIDLYVAVESVAHERLLNTKPDMESLREFRRRIKRARDLQAVRYGSTQKLNADMTNRDIKQFAELTPEAKTLLDQAATQLDISARSYMRTIKVARTIADLDNSPKLKATHVAEALQYRNQRYQLQQQSA